MKPSSYIKPELDLIDVVKLTRKDPSLIPKLLEKDCELWESVLVQWYGMRYSYKISQKPLEGVVTVQLALAYGVPEMKYALPRAKVMSLMFGTYNIWRLYEAYEKSCPDFRIEEQRTLTFPQAKARFNAGDYVEILRG